ncbi:hypothetical protein BGX33_002119 [Mortierella sp. NVP41]|nr:hypothetical protein BGX33_002119 [Mortierella sp. NVP41]
MKLTSNLYNKYSHSYRVRPSPLPRPLHLRRPIVTDTSITPSSKVVTTIGRGAPVVVQDDDSNSPIEPPVVIIGKSPVLMAMGINMLSHSPSSASAASQRATPPAKSTARKVSIRRQATATTLAGSQTQAASTQAQTQTQTQTQQTPQQQVTQIRNGYAEEESEEELENPFMSKEEFQRQAPQAILPKDFKHAQFTVPLPSLPNTNMVENDSSDDEEGDLNTGRLVLEPYLTPAELAAFLVPAVAPKHVQEELSTSSSVSTGQSTNTAPTPSAPARPPRRVPDAADQPNQSQSQIQGQRQQRHDGQGHAQAQPPQNIHSLAPSPEVPWSLPSDGSLGLSSILATIPGQQPPASPPSPAPPSPSPSPTPSLSSTKSSTSSMRTRPPPPTLPPPRGSRSSSASQSGSERAMSPAPSLSYSSSNISTGLSIISSQPDTIVTDVSSFVSLGDTPTTTASMMCASPTFQPVLSPTSPATPATARSFSVSTAASPVSSRRPPGRSPPITAESGDDYGWSEQDNNNTGNTDDDKTVVGQAKKKRVPQAIGGGTRLSRFNFDI